MATSPQTIDFILQKLGNRFSARSMFGEYALYADGKTVGFVCDDILYIKILPASKELENVCEKGPAYPGSKPYYIVEESQIVNMDNLSNILYQVAASVPAKRKKK